MPIYEFECQACAHKFETLSRSSSESPACPKCSSGDVKRLLSNFGFKGKGSDGKVTTSGSSGCSTCSGGSCASCH